MYVVGFDTLEFDDDEPREIIDPDPSKKPPLKLMSFSDTRWLVISDCVERILKQYDALTAHFDIVNTNGKDYDARILFDMFRDEQNRSLLLFLFPVHRNTQFYPIPPNSTQLHTKLYPIPHKMQPSLIQYH